MNTASSPGRGALGGLGLPSPATLLDYEVADGVGGATLTQKKVEAK